MDMRIGVVGIGKMGQPIASRLLAAGNEVSICSRTRNAGVESLAERGATVSASPAELAARVDVILTALPTEDSVKDVYGEMSDVAVSGQIFVDHSTVSINLNRWCAERLSARHASFLDAPVSGGPAGAEAGTLTVMVGGDDEAFKRALPVFEQFGTKILNQLLVAVHTTASAEAASLAVQLGADLSTVQDVIGTSFGSSAMLLRNLPRFITQDFSPATPIGLIAKDLSIIHREADSAGVQLLLGSVAEQCFLDAKARGWTAEDMSALVKFWAPADGSGD